MFFSYIFLRLLRTANNGRPSELINDLGNQNEFQVPAGKHGAEQVDAEAENRCIFKEKLSYSSVKNKRRKNIQGNPK